MLIHHYSTLVTCAMPCPVQQRLCCHAHYLMSTRSYVMPFTEPPVMLVLTFRLKFSLFVLRSSAASLFNGSDAFGSKNKNYHPCQHFLIPQIPVMLTCIPTMTAFRFNTGFQSSRRMFKHTLPSRSMFGW